jgi:hypothetical protein
MRFLLPALIMLIGCARFRSVQQNPDGTKTTVVITTFFDSNNEVSKLHTTQTEKTQGITLGSISENSSSTNVVELLRLLGGILATLPK